MPLHPACYATRTEKPFWTTEDLQKVVKKLTKAPHHAVAEQNMQATLGSRGGEMLQSLVLHSAVRVRHASDLRSKVDAHSNSLLGIPADPDKRNMIIAISPAQQFAMTSLLNQQPTS